MLLDDERFDELSEECANYMMENPEVFEELCSSIFTEIYETIKHELLEKIYKADKETGLAVWQTMMDDAIIEQGFVNGVNNSFQANFGEQE